MSVLNNLLYSLQKLGAKGTANLLAEKRAKQIRLKKLPLSPQHHAELIIHPDETGFGVINQNEKEATIEKAELMLRDKNFFFTFPYSFQGVTDPWNYDPIEKKLWPIRRYEETKVHGLDT